ncbi:MAG: right-handed parallel beta-helix repeat-containing protein [Bacteroidia bacterium]|nr:right-handed parallel beta-helix repeat-containing protein [Bacteroidia bacterium]
MYKLTLILMLFFTITVSQLHAKAFYVSPRGNDTNAGTTKESAFATIARARDEVRTWKQSNTTEEVTVWLAGGSYSLTETLKFEIADGAAPGQSVTYSALPGERPVINSDVHLTGWTKVKKALKGLPTLAKGNVWVATVPQPLVDFKVLFNTDSMLPRARTKALRNLRVRTPVGSGQDYTTLPITVTKGVSSNLFYPSNAEISVIPIYNWTMNILPVQSYNDTTGMITLAASSSYPLKAPWSPKESVWIENTFAGLDAPGKWVLDKSARLVYYWPLDNVTPGADIVAPALIELIRVEGSIDYDGAIDTPVRGLVFRGLTFTHGNRYDAQGRTGRSLQHDWERFDCATALVRFRGAEGCAVENCQFTNSGGAGVRFDLYAQNNTVYNSEFAQLGGTGILFAGYGAGTKDVNKNNTIDNNYIHGIGKLFWQSLGIFVWQSGHNTISHNTIHDTPYTGMAVTGRIGWDKTGVGECSGTVRWKEVGGFSGKEPWEERERFLHARGNLVKDNDIYDVMKTMYDGNGIYISGTGSGNVVCGNYVHDTPSTKNGQAIRCDDDQHEVTIYNNVVFKFGTSGIGILSKGRNQIFNNIVALPPAKVDRGLIALDPINAKGLKGSKIMHNILLANQASQPFICESKIKLEIGIVDIFENLYYNTSNPTAGEEYLKWAQANGYEKASLQADPLFLNAEMGDFRLSPNSPALQLGFKPFTLDAGRKIK